MSSAAEGSANDDSVYASAYSRLPEKPASTVRFFDRGGDGETYVVYGADAALAAKEVFQTTAVIRKFGHGDRKVECVYLSRANFEAFVRDLLLVKQFRVEVYVNEGNKARIEWAVKYRGSPGNLTQFEDILFANNEVTVNNGVVGIRISNVGRNKTIGIGFVNMNEWEIHLIELVDNDAFTNFESVIVQLSPKEAVFPTSLSQSDDVSALRKVLERNGVLVNERKVADFDSKDIHQDLNRLFKKNKSEVQTGANPELEKTLAVSGLAGVIKYLELSCGEAYTHQFRLKPFDSGLFVKMDSSACRALHLSLNSLEISSRKDVSLLSVIDKCRTSQGHRLLAQYLKQPLVSIEKLEERLDMVEVLINDLPLRQALHEEHLRKVPDCPTIARKLYKKKATLQDCYKAYVFLVKLPKLVQDLENHESSLQHVLKSCITDPIKCLQEELEKFTELIQTTLDIERAERGDFIVRSDFDDSLKVLREKMDEIEKQMQRQTDKVANILSLEANKSLKLESNSMSGYFFRVTMKDEKLIRNSKEFQIIHSKKDGVAFRNSALEDLSQQYLKRISRYEEEQKDIVAQVIDVATSYHSCFEELGGVLAQLDVLTSFALVSASSCTPYVRPKLHPKGTGVMKFTGLRHPCVEIQPDVCFIPNDVLFEKDKQMFYIVTGPNMGGKSTYLRSLGVATLLAHVGCFVPATEAEVSVVDAILARVGAGDNLTKGVSTFMSEMIETSFILKTATSDSLVIIDELGRGTSTYDGFGLCWAISEHLAKEVACFCILATHFHELTVLAEEVPTVKNYHVTAVADTEGLTMLFKIEKGPCDRSFGIHVASQVDFPAEVIEKATNMAKKLEDFSSTDQEDADEAAVKKRRDYKTAGQEAIDEFLLKVKSLHDEYMEANPDRDLEEQNPEYLKQVETLLEEVKKQAESNPYLKHLLERSGSTSK